MGCAFSFCFYPCRSFVCSVSCSCAYVPFIFLMWVFYFLVPIGVGRWRRRRCASEPVDQARRQAHRGRVQGRGLGRQHARDCTRAPPTRRGGGHQPVRRRHAMDARRRSKRRPRRRQRGGVPQRHTARVAARIRSGRRRERGRDVLPAQAKRGGVAPALCLYAKTGPVSCRRPPSRCSLFPND